MTATTKGERREAKARKARYGMRVTGRSVLLLSALASGQQPPRKRKARRKAR